jgi:hypothetical protein
MRRNDVAVRVTRAKDMNQESGVVSERSKLASPSSRGSREALRIAGSERGDVLRLGPKPEQNLWPRDVHQVRTAQHRVGVGLRRVGGQCREPTSCADLQLASVGLTYMDAPSSEIDPCDGP